MYRRIVKILLDGRESEVSGFVKSHFQKDVEAKLGDVVKQARSGSVVAAMDCLERLKVNPNCYVDIGTALAQKAFDILVTKPDVQEIDVKIAQEAMTALKSHVDMNALYAAYRRLWDDVIPLHRATNNVDLLMAIGNAMWIALHPMRRRFETFSTDMPDVEAALRALSHSGVHRDTQYKVIAPIINSYVPYLLVKR